MARPLRSSVRIGHGNRPSGWSLRTSGRRIVVGEGLCPFKRHSRHRGHSFRSQPRGRVEPSLGTLRQARVQWSVSADWRAEEETDSHQRGGDSATTPLKRRLHWRKASRLYDSTLRGRVVETQPGSTPGPLRWLRRTALASHVQPDPKGARSLRSDDGSQDAGSSEHAADQRQTNASVGL